MTLGGPILGCDCEYEFCLTDSCGDTVLRTLPNVCKFKFNRILDNISDSRVSFGVEENPQCRDIVDFICLGRHYLTIKRNGIVEWKGPTRRIEYADDVITLYASDPLWWTKRRVVPPFYTTEIGGAGGDYVGLTFGTPAEFFETRVLERFVTTVDQYAGTYNLPGLGYDKQFGECPSNFDPVCFDRMLANYTALAADGSEPITIVTKKSQKYVTLFTLLQELAKSVIDYTVVGNDLLYGYATAPVPQDRLQPTPILTNDSWCSPPRVVKDISTLANDVFIDTKLEASAAGAEAPQLLDSIYPDGTLRVSDCDFFKHGYHQKILNKTRLASFEEAEQAGLSYLRQNGTGSSINYIENTRSSQLSSLVAWDLPRMVPGMLVNADIDKYGLTVNETMRLHEVIVEGDSKTKEKVKVTLEPVGVS